MGIINSVKRGPWSQVDGLNPFFFFLPLLFNLLGTKEISVWRGKLGPGHTLR